jgi:hypothetical protein
MDATKPHVIARRADRAARQSTHPAGDIVAEFRDLVTQGALIGQVSSLL